MRVARLLALLTLAACGVDGPPQPPGTAPGVSLSGEVQMGVVRQ